MAYCDTVMAMQAYGETIGGLKGTKGRVHLSTSNFIATVAMIVYGHNEFTATINITKHLG